MKFINTIFFSLLMIVSYSQTYTTMTDKEGFKKKLSEYATTNSTISSNFTQEKNLSILESKVTSKGKFQFKKDNKVRWEITSPDPYLVIINGSTISIEENDTVKTYDMNSNKIFKQIHETFLGCLQGTIADNTTQYSITYYQSSANYMIKLTPVDKKIKDYVSEVQIVFNMSTLNVEKITITEPSGDYTDIKFSGTVLNGTINDSVFQP